jgi:CHAT domain-containing protein/tetratricopeptide (TPR) repeat protein
MRVAYPAIIIAGLVASASPVIAAQTSGTDDRQVEYLALRRTIGERRFDNALLRCGQLIDRYPDYLYLYETLAEVALYARRLPDALTYFKRRMETGEGIQLACFGAGSVYYEMRDYRAAVRALTRAIELGLSAPECYKMLEYSYERLDGVDAAVRLFNSLCHRHSENANYWYAAALAYWGKHDYKKVMRNINQALTLCPDEPKFLEAKAAMLLLLGDIQQGRDLTSRLISLADQRSDLGGKLFLQSHLVFSHIESNNPDSVRALSFLMADRSREYGSLRWLAWSLMRVADIDLYAANVPEALLKIRTALKVAEVAQNNDLLFEALAAEFRAFLDLGDYASALTSAVERLRKSRDAGDEWQFIRSLVAVALAYHEIGLQTLAMDYVVEALNRTEPSAKDPEILYQIHNTLGMIHQSQGHYKTALNHYKFGYDLTPSTAESVHNLLVSLGLLGNVYIRLGDFQNPLRLLQKRLGLSRNNEFKIEESQAILDLGHYNFWVGRYGRAHKQMLKALALGKSLRQKHVIAESMRALAGLLEKNGDTHGALDWYANASEFSDKHEGFNAFFSSQGMLGLRLLEDHEQYARLLCAVGEIDKAFVQSERAKLALGFERLGIASRSVSEGFPDSVRLWLSGVKSELHEVYSKLADLSTSDFSVESAGRRLMVRSDLENLEIRRRELMVGAAPWSTLYSLVGDRQGSWLNGLRDSVLAADQALLEYVVGAGQTEAFLLKKDTLVHFTVKRTREELRELIGRLSYLFEKNVSGVSLANATLANFDSRTSSELYQLLVQPVEHQLDTIRRLVVVPDDPLGQLPFEILITNRIEGNPLDYSNMKFLVEAFEVSYAPAAVSLMFHRGVTRNAGKTLLAFGSFLLPPSAGTSVADLPMEAMQIFPNVEPRKLAGVQRELIEIHEVFGREVDLLSGRDASKKNFLERAADYKVLHIAGHARSEPDLPLKSSIYVGPAEGGKQSETIRAFEIMDLELNAELAVISGCNTAYSGSMEGVGGLVQAFMLAGVPSVVASLWSVDDEATADLMGRFYHYLHEGERKGRALQLAKVDMIRSGRSDPFYWGAFVLVGDSSPISSDSPGDSVGPALAGGSLLLLAIIGLLLRRRVRNTNRGLTETC